MADSKLSWWAQQDFSDLTDFQVECDRGIVDYLEAQKAKVDLKLAELSNTEPWASDMVFLMQIPGFGLLFSMNILAAIGDISRFDSPKKLVGDAGLGAGVDDSGKKHQDKSITQQGRKELRWALVEAAWAAVRSDPHRKAQYEHFKQTKHPNKAIVAVARKMLVSVWYILTNREPYCHADDDTLAYKMMMSVSLAGIWSQRMDENALRGVTRQQYVKYDLLFLGTGQDLTRIVRNGAPRRSAPSDEVLALNPDLSPPG